LFLVSRAVCHRRSQRAHRPRRESFSIGCTLVQSHITHLREPAGARSYAIACTLSSGH
jgi:hypothetical protein